MILHEKSFLCPNWFQPVQQSGQETLRAYCPNIYKYTGPKGHHYGLSLLTSIVSGLLLPRFAITMDTGKFIYWDNFAKLSSDWGTFWDFAVFKKTEKCRNTN